MQKSASRKSAGQSRESYKKPITNIVTTAHEMISDQTNQANDKAAIGSGLYSTPRGATKQDTGARKPFS